MIWPYMDLNTCFKGRRSSIELILTSKRYSFKHNSSNETYLSDHDLISAIMKTTFDK